MKKKSNKKELFKYLHTHLKFQKRLSHEPIKKQEYSLGLLDFTFYNNLVFELLQSSKLLIKINKNKISRYFIFSTFYLNLFVLKSFFKTNIFNIQTLFDKNQIVIINNKNTQIFTTLLKNNLIIKSFSTGFVLTFFKLFKKCLRRKLTSFVLQLKMLINMIDKFYIDDFFVFNIKGTKKNFFKWLNFLKFNIKNFKVLLYVYTPSVFYYPVKIKKIKSIKKRMKKKYLYSEDFT